MTKATRRVREGDSIALRPTTREVETRFDGPMIVDLHDTYLAMRPKRARRNGPAEVLVNWGSIYQRALIERHIERQRERRRARKARKGGSRR